MVKKNNQRIRNYFIMTNLKIESSIFPTVISPILFVHFHPGTSAAIYFNNGNQLLDIRRNNMRYGVGDICFYKALGCSISRDMAQAAAPFTRGGNIYRAFLFLFNKSQEGKRSVLQWRIYWMAFARFVYIFLLCPSPLI